LPESADNSPGQFSFRTVEDVGPLFEAVLASLQELMVILSSDLTVQAANPAFCNFCTMDIQQTIGRKLQDLGDRQWDIPELLRLLNGVIAEGAVVSGHRIDQEFERVGRRVLLVNAHRAHRSTGEALIVLVLHDHTEIEVAREYSDKLVDALRDPFLVLDWDLRVKFANGPFYKTFEVQPSPTEGRLIYELGNGQWNIPDLRELLD
jgi:PAS domain-containing protein